jgi:hypothetical protein
MRSLAHEPLTRPSDTLSPSDGEREGERGFRLTLNALWNKMVCDFANHGIAGAKSRLQAGAPLNRYDTHRYTH